MSHLAPPTVPTCRHLRPGSEYGDGTVGVRAGKHLGVDFQPTIPGGEDWVYAVEGGTVEALFTTIPHGDGRNPLYAGHTGNIVAIRADSGRIWTYQHGKDFQVERGQRVNAGDKLHRMWRSGRSTGNHLHLGLRVNGKFVDPEPVLRENNAWPVANSYYISRDFTPAATTPATPEPAPAKEPFTMDQYQNIMAKLDTIATGVPFTSTNGKRSTTSIRSALGYLSTNQTRAVIQSEALLAALTGLATGEDVETIKAHIDQRITELGLNADGNPAAETDTDAQEHQEAK